MREIYFSTEYAANAEPESSSAVERKAMFDTVVFFTAILRLDASDYPNNNRPIYLLFLSDIIGEKKQVSLAERNNISACCCKLEKRKLAK